jgi:hypothetical protein
MVFVLIAASTGTTILGFVTLLLLAAVLAWIFWRLVTRPRRHKPSDGFGSEIVVMSDREWHGDPHPNPKFGSGNRWYITGMYDVLLDGRKAGALPARGRVVLSCNSGPHRVRVGQLWASSPTLEVRVEDGETIMLQADMADRDRSFLYRMGTMLFRPGRFLSLWVVPNGEPSREAGE